MKRFAVLIAAMLVLTLIPSAHAALRIQGVGSNLYSFDGPTRINYADSAFSGTYYRNNDRMYIGAGSTGQGPFVGVQLQRPTYTQNHYFQQPKYNYRTYESGDWQLQQAHASWPEQNTNIRVGQRYGQYAIQGNINGYAGGSTGSYALHRGYQNFGYANNMRSYGYPHTYSSYGYTSRPSAYVSSGSAYY